MSFFEILLIGIGLGMDALSVSICKGLAMKKMNWKKSIIIGLYFGTFQALMPILGFFIGTNFQYLVDKISQLVAFFLLTIIGINMIRESWKNENKQINDSVKFNSMIILALATSIDALTAGISLAILKVNILNTSIIIGIATFIMSVCGVKVGNLIGEKIRGKAEVLGGIILITMGIKVLIT